jgi:UDP-N-acetylmuramate dehydrogenase
MNNWQEFIEKIKPNIIKEANNATAKLYTEIDKIDNLIKVVTQARLHKIPIFIIGSGSWAEIPDGEINGLVIKNNCRKFDLFEMQGKIIVYSESGTLFNQLTRFTIEEGLKGLEYQLGLPGTVGGAIYTNARYTPKRKYVNDIIEKIKIINEQNEIQEVAGDYFISRASSEFSPANAIILSAIFQLARGDKKILWERGDEAVAYRKKKYE